MKLIMIKKKDTSKTHYKERYNTEKTKKIINVKRIRK